MNLSIIKRIEAVERLVAKPPVVPVLVMIYYDQDDKTGKPWAVKETIGTLDQKGKIQGQCHDMVYHYPRLSEYRFHPDFMGSVIIDMTGSPQGDEGGLYSFNAKDLRKECRASKCAFSLEYQGSTGKLQGGWIITVITSYTA